MVLVLTICSPVLRCHQRSGSSEADWRKARTKTIESRATGTTFLKLRTRPVLKRLVLVWVGCVVEVMSIVNKNHPTRALRRLYFERYQRLILGSNFRWLLRPIKAVT